MAAPSPKTGKSPSSKSPSSSKSKIGASSPSKKKSPSKASGLSTSSSGIPVIAKQSVWTKKVLVCQSDDTKLNFAGDSGAIGRITASNEDHSLQLDLKGRQYNGKIMSGPTIMLLNLAPPVGQANYKEVARADVLTNEFCHLEFTRDVLGGIMGEYTGGLSRYDDKFEDEVLDMSTSTKDQGGVGNDSKDKKNPIISNVMNRKRKASTKSKSKVTKIKKK